MQQGAAGVFKIVLVTVKCDSCMTLQLVFLYFFWTFIIANSNWIYHVIFYIIYRIYKNLSPVTLVQMGFSGLKGDCVRSTEALPRYCRNSHPRAGNFHLYQLLVIVSFSCITFLKIKIVQMGLVFAFINALYFYRSILIYAFIHKCSNDVIWPQTSLIDFTWHH